MFWAWLGRPWVILFFFCGVFEPTFVQVRFICPFQDSKRNRCELEAGGRCCQTGGGSLSGYPLGILEGNFIRLRPGLRPGAVDLHASHLPPTSGMLAGRAGLLAGLACWLAGHPDAMLQQRNYLFQNIGPPEAMLHPDEMKCV